MTQKAAALVKSLRDRPVEYARLVGFDKLTEIHNGWIRAMMLATEDQTLLGHRGSYKTTCLSFAFALLIVLIPARTIFFIRKTDDDVIEIVEQVRKILSSDLFAYIVREIYGIELELTTSSAYKISTNLATSTRGQVQLQGMGLKGSLTGKHSDLIFTDDIVNIKDRVSRAEREQTKRQYMELQNIKNRGGRLFNTATVWHRDDCISLMPNIHKYTVYDTGLISEVEQHALRASMSPSLYAANYELKLIADADALFSAPSFYEGDASAIHGGRAHIDAAYGGSDYTAYTILKRQPDGSFVGYGRIWQGHVDGCLTAIRLLHCKYRAGSVTVEKNADKGYLARDLRKLGLPVIEYSEKENKYIKIATHLRSAWPRIQWLPDTDPEYLNQILDYTEHAEHDDAPDSAASLIRAYGQQGRIGNKDALLYG